MELELGLALRNNHLMNEFDLEDGNAASSYRKRDFAEAFDKAIPFSSPLPSKTTLPLFVHGNGGDEDDEKGSPQSNNPHELNSGSRALAGLPPIKYPRRSSGSGEAENQSEDDSGGGRRAKCVKVKMEGVAIGRKVDLTLCNSYEALFQTLNQMFPNNPHGEVMGIGHRMVIYEDGEGDWLLIGDVPWEAFTQSVKRLRILKLSK